MKALDVVKGVMTAVAPTLATALGGPLAGMAVSKISQALTSKPDTSPAELAAAIQQSTDPDLLVKLKQADAEFAEQMKKLDVDLEAISEKDRESARGREVALRDLTPRVLSYMVVVMTILGEGWILMHGLPASIDGVIVGRVLGTLDAALVLVLSYYFGTSAGADRSREILADQAEPKQAK